MDNLQFDDSTKVGRVSLTLSSLADRFSPQKELASFLEREQAHARVNESTRNLTSMCWDKSVSQITSLSVLISSRCITSTPGSRFARGEESCLANCVERFLDTSIFIVNQVQRQQQQLLQSHEAPPSS